MTTKRFFQMTALMLGMVMTSVMMTSCSAEDNPVDVPGDVPSVGGTTVKTLKELTTTEIGWVIAADSKAYPNPAAAKAAGTEALAMLGCVHGSLALAVQITDCPLEINWENAKEYVNTLPKVEGASWVLPSLAEWEDVFKSCAVSGDATERVNNMMNPINGFKDKFLATGMAWPNYWYWTSTEKGQDNAWIVGTNITNTPVPYAGFGDAPKSYPYAARAFLSFWVNW